jgi:anti-anti-sigma factor
MTSSIIDQLEWQRLIPGVRWHEGALGAYGFGWTLRAGDDKCTAAGSVDQVFSGSGKHSEPPTQSAVQTFISGIPDKSQQRRASTSGKSTYTGNGVRPWKLLHDQRRILVDQIRSSKVGSVVVDFAKVEYFGSFLLDTLCVVWKEIRQRSGNMSLCHLSEVPGEILERSRLDRLWAVRDSRQAAIKAVSHESVSQPAVAGGSNGSM